jgi:hypothetical protein
MHELKEKKLREITEAPVLRIAVDLDYSCSCMSLAGDAGASL